MAGTAVRRVVTLEDLDSHATERDVGFRELAMTLAAANDDARRAFIARLSAEERDAFFFCWRAFARREQLEPKGDWWRFWLACAGRGWGKALDVDTAIPTPTGWSRLGDLRIGDAIFDEGGRPCRITATFDPPVSRAFRLTFSDGTTVDACEDHQWVTLDRLTRKRLCRRGVVTDPRSWANGRATITTSQLVASLRSGGSRQDLNHAIPLAGALELPEAALPIDPYLLGIWLGDGDSAGSMITTADPEILEEIERRGEIVGKPFGTDGGKAMRYRIGNAPPVRDRTTGRMLPNESLHSRLRALGVIDNKHVPAIYLRASIQQRRDLLAGLMDSDGSAEPSRVEFCTTKKVLADAVMEIARSLGEQPRLHEDRARLDGVDHGPRYRVRWRPLVTPFYLARKARITRALGAQSSRVRQRMVVDAVEIAPKPMRCLTVDSPNAMFLAGEAMIPTHNSKTGAEWVRDNVMSGRAGRIALIGRTEDDVEKVMIDGAAGILKCCPRQQRPKWLSSKGTLTWPNGAVATVFSSQEPEKLRGPEHDLVWIDELGKLMYAEETWSNMDLGLRVDGPKGDRPRCLATTTPRPTPTMRDLFKREGDDVVITRGTTFDNASNLSQGALASLIKKYRGTRLGRQELKGEMLDDVVGANWTRQMIDDALALGARMDPFRKADDQTPQEDWRIRLAKAKRVVIGVDPAASDPAEKRRRAKREDDEIAETGIVVDAVFPAGLYHKEESFLCVADLSLAGAPHEWAKAVVDAYWKFGASCVYAEKNNGGEMVRSTIHNVDANVHVELVWASESKMARAEPISALYAQGRYGHLHSHPQLEDQCCSFTGARNDKSPDRHDAHVWASTGLITMKTQKAVSINPRLGHVGRHWSSHAR